MGNNQMSFVDLIYEYRQRTDCMQHLMCCCIMSLMHLDMKNGLLNCAKYVCELTLHDAEEMTLFLCSCDQSVSLLRV